MGNLPFPCYNSTGERKGTFASEAWYLSFVGFSDVVTERRGETEACRAMWQINSSPCCILKDQLA